MKQFKRILTLILALSVLLCFLCSCSENEETSNKTDFTTSDDEKEETSSQKVFTVKELSITLTKNFNLTPTTYYLAAYVNESDDAIVHVVRESKSVINDVAGKEINTPMAYAELVIASNKKGSDPREGDGYVYYTFSAASKGIDYTYLCTVYESENAFWLLQFSVKSAEFNDYYDEFVSYAKSVTFDESYQKA